MKMHFQVAWSNCKWNCQLKLEYQFELLVKTIFNTIIWICCSIGVFQFLTWSVVVVGGLLLILNVTMTQQLGHADWGSSLLIIRPDEVTQTALNHPQRWTKTEKYRSADSHLLLYLLPNDKPSIWSAAPSGDACGMDSSSNSSLINTQNTNEFTALFHWGTDLWVGVKHIKRKIYGENKRWG